MFPGNLIFIYFFESGRLKSTKSVTSLASIMSFFISNMWNGRP